MTDPQLDAAPFSTTLWAWPSGNAPVPAAGCSFSRECCGRQCQRPCWSPNRQHPQHSCIHQEGHLVIKGLLAADESSVAHPVSTFSQWQSCMERSRQVKQLGWSPSVSFLPGTAQLTDSWAGTGAAALLPAPWPWSGTNSFLLGEPCLLFHT